MSTGWIFEHDNFLDVLSLQIERQGKSRGYKSQMARAAGCQPAYLSQALAGSVQLTLDHAAGLVQFWGFEPLESEYFLNLVSISRAATPTLREQLQRRQNQIRKEHEQTKDHSLSHKPHDEEAMLDYFSDWMNAAIHSLLSSDERWTVKKLADHLRESVERVQKTINLLANLGFIKNDRGAWRTTNNYFHAADLNRFAPYHHRNWREQAQPYYSHRGLNPRNYHYTGLSVLSQKDFEEVRQMMSRTVKEVENKLDQSKGSDLYCLNVDFFKRR